MFLGDKTIAIVFVRVPAERRERKVLADVRQAHVKQYFEAFWEPGGYPETSRERPGHPSVHSMDFSSIFEGPRAAF